MRRLLAGAALPVLLVGAACQARQGADSDLPDCSGSGCAEEVTALADAIAGLDGVRDVRDVEYQPSQITASPSVDGEVVVDPDVDCASLEEPVGRLLWASKVSPVNNVTLRCFLPGAEPSDYDYVSYSFYPNDQKELTAEWGPRGAG